MSNNRNFIQTIFGRLFKNEQEEQVRTWVQQVTDGGESANEARMSLLELEPEMVMPILEKIVKEHPRSPLAKTADTIYKALLESVTERALSMPMEDLTIGSERLTPGEFLDRYGKEAFEKRYGVAASSSGGQTLLAGRDARSSR